MTTVETTTDLPFQEWAVAAAEMRRLHLKTAHGNRYDLGAATALRDRHAVLREAAASDAANQIVVDLRGHAQPLTYPNRHHAVQSVRTNAWHAEERLVVHESGIMSAPELSALRRRAERDLARAKSRSRHPAHPRVLHELAGDRPLEELIARLATEQILDVGSPQFPKLTKLQRRTRRSLVDRDLRGLEATAVLLLNARNAVPSVFVISYSLAVGSITAV